MDEPQIITVQYNFGLYEVGSLEEARMLTVTPEQGVTTDERWNKETPYLLKEILRHLPITAETRVLDYGCGTGRMSKAMIEATGCRVFGVDAANAMRTLSPEYVLSERFTPWSPAALARMIETGWRADAAICMWVIQHAYNPAEVIQLLHDALPPGGLLLTLNTAWRCAPTDRGYINDGFDVQGQLAQTFEELERYHMTEEGTTADIASYSIFQLLRRRA